jgi:hypothetical protein
MHAPQGFTRTAAVVVAVLTAWPHSQTLPDCLWSVAVGTGYVHCRRVALLVVQRWWCR